MRYRFFTLCIILFVACNQQRDTHENNDDEHQLSAKVDSTLELQLIKAGLVNVQDIIPEVQVTLKYSTTDNFLMADVYGDLTNAYLQKDVAEKLKTAYAYLQQQHPELTFIIYDAVRPLHIQFKMWEILDLPPGEKEKYLSNPKNGSIHNYGAALDIGLVNKKGVVLDMGTPFDFFGPEAEPQLEYQMLAQGKITQAQIDNRKILRSAMLYAGFRQLPTEWWHYNACSREQAKVLYRVVP
jgi:zinc D-Ala-D-Ala dipeptidase